MKSPLPMLPETMARTTHGKVLLIDNYDSFTYNIRGLLASIGVDAEVVRNDQITIQEIESMNPSHIIVGPGPGTPDHPEDIGITNEVIAYAIRERKALLGVCLGHQAIAHAFGANIVQADEILHGKSSVLDIGGDKNSGEASALFADVDSDPSVMRYHSLVADKASFPSELRVVASTRDATQTIMAFEHVELPIAGVQFHPESFATPDGRKIMKNFLRFDPAAFEDLLQKGVMQPAYAPAFSSVDSRIAEKIDSLDMQGYRELEFPCDLPPGEVYSRLHAGSDHMFSFESLGETSSQLSYFGAEPSFVLSGCNEEFQLDDAVIERTDGSAYDMLVAAVESLRSKMPEASENVPLRQKFSGGFVGGIAYESVQYSEPTALPPEGRTPVGEKTFSFAYYPDGLVYDSNVGSYKYFTRGADRRALFLDLLSREARSVTPVIRKESDGMSQEEYERHVREVRDREIRTGNSFQTVISRKKSYVMEEGSMAPLYRRMRDMVSSPNMHAVKMGKKSESIGSFPELTIKIENGMATTYQVAGTRPRTGNAEVDDAVFAELMRDPKEVAEHTMLVDLARNDLERVSIPGTVHIPEGGLMHRLDAGRVMHIATEIRSRIHDIPALMALLNVAPMGTVSGAPKVRSMQILNKHEHGESRGHYAGSFGFVDLRGNAEFVVGLRSIGRQGNRLTVQAGAGIVYDSIPENEYRETHQKMGTASLVLEPFLAL